MYRIYANKICIHDGLSQDPTKKAAEAKLTEEDNCAGSLEFLIPPGNVGYDVINLMTTDIIVTRTDHIGAPETSIWMGRATRCDVDFYNRKSYYCEGALSFLVDTIQDKRIFEGTIQEFLQNVLESHNAKVNQNRRINLGNMQVTIDIIIKVDIDYATTLDTINACLIEKFGGHIQIETPTNYSSSPFESRPSLYYYSDWKTSTAQPIDFGKNLLDLTRNFDVTDIVTAILPRGSSTTNDNGVESYVDISSVNNGSKILVNDELKNQYGYIEKVVDFSDIEEPQDLLEAAELYFSTSQFDDVSIEISAFDMSYLRFGNQTDVVYSPFKVLDKVHCLSKPHGLNRDFPITKIVTDLIDPAGGSITLNSSKVTNISSMGSGTITVNQIQKSGGYEQVDSDIYAIWEPAIGHIEYYTGYVYDSSTSRAINYGVYYPIEQTSSNTSPFKSFCSGEMTPQRIGSNGISSFPYSTIVIMAWGFITTSPISVSDLSDTNIRDIGISTETDGTYLQLFPSYDKFPATNIVTKERRLVQYYLDTFRALIGDDNLPTTKLIFSFSLLSDAEKYIEHVLSSEWKGARQYSYISKTILNRASNNSNPQYYMNKDALPVMASGLLTVGDIKDGMPCSNWKNKISFYSYNPLFGVNNDTSTKDLFIKGMMEGDYTNGIISIRGSDIGSISNMSLSSPAALKIAADTVDFTATKIFF